jgi:hypothetical protein
MGLIYYSNKLKKKNRVNGRWCNEDCFEVRCDGGDDNGGFDVESLSMVGSCLSQARLGMQLTRQSESDGRITTTLIN